jgi:hypothetical protein
MRSHRLVPVVLAAAVILAGASGKAPRLVDLWSDPDYTRGSFDKLVVLGITADREVRNRFEDKFVTHLRARGYRAVTSYSLVPDLSAPQERREIIEEVRRRDIDGVIAIRLIPVKDEKEKAWAASWRQSMKDPVRLRQLIDETLPLELEKGGKYVVDVGLWETQEWTRVWAGRTSRYTRKHLRRQGGTFVLLVMNALEDDRLL